MSTFSCRCNEMLNRNSYVSDSELRNVVCNKSLRDCLTIKEESINNVTTIFNWVSAWPFFWWNENAPQQRTEPNVNWGATLINSGQVTQLTRMKGLHHTKKDHFKLGLIAKIVSDLNKMYIVCSVGFFFIKNACANFLTPYTAHPPTRSEATVTQRVEKREKKFEKKAWLSNREA